jgi:hypothetical protein
MHNGENEGKLSTSQLIMVPHEKIVKPLLIYQIGWIKQKTIARYCPFNIDSLAFTGLIKDSVPGVSNFTKLGTLLFSI